jgi:hypothetical protein
VKRLPEQFDLANPDEAYLAKLLKDVDPAQPSAEQMRRVWTTLERRAPRRPRGRASGPVIAGLLLCGATVASATMPDVWKRLQRAYVEAMPDVTAVETTTVTKAAPRRAPPVAPPLPVAVLDASEAAALLPQAAVAQQPAADVRKSTSSRSRTTLPEPVDSLASGALMVEAMRERRAGNIARARELASEYRTKHPAGALSEEALALSFETAAALGDEEARKLAGLYLQRHPQGRFRAQAQRVVDNAR